MPPTPSAESSSCLKRTSSSSAEPSIIPNEVLLPNKASGGVTIKLYYQVSSSKIDETKPLGFFRLSQPTTLNSLRSLLASEIDVPEQITSSKNWSNLDYIFIIDNFPVGLKQEELIRIPEDVPSNMITLKFSSANKKRKFDDFDNLKPLNDLSKPTEKKEVKEVERFRVVVEDIINCQGDITGQRKYLVFNNDPDSPDDNEYETSEACTILRNLTNLNQFYSKKSKVKQDALLFHLPKITELTKNNPHNEHLFRGLINYLKKEYEDVTDTISRMLEEGRISFDNLWYVFQKDTLFQARMGEDVVGSSVVESRYVSSFFGESFQVTGSFISTNGKSFSNVSKTLNINEFEGTRELSDLSIRPLTEDTKAKLIERGKVFRSIALGSHYLHYSGSMKYIEWCIPKKFKADGRIMVDTATFQRFNPNYKDFRATNEDESKIVSTIADEKLFMTWPTVPGFSFSAKKWGEFSISNISPVIFDDLAFSRLVLNEETKRLVRCLVTNSGHCFTDIISGKGGGVIFLCHGPPGTGKTLTAEAVSELLHKPLYCVNIGELGVTPKQMEEKLSQILEMASSWNAIILLDEADIFLERRTNNDVERNALVGIFLRLLEYHQGVLFLTTNRVQSFDEAFHSRISIALQYQPLSLDARKKIWKNLLEAAHVESELNLDELAEYDLNGRQIKNIIRLAQTIALEDKKPVSKSDIEKCVNVAKQFQTDVKHLKEQDEILQQK